MWQYLHNLVHFHFGSVIKFGICTLVKSTVFYLSESVLQYTQRAKLCRDESLRKGIDVVGHEIKTPLPSTP